MITQDIDLAVRALKAGDLVAFPTETVYGLGADAFNPQAIAKVFSTKGRPTSHPIIVHIANISKLTTLARDIPVTAYQMAENFWPGPLTLILKKQPTLAPAISGGLDTVALRIPNHPLTLTLLETFGGAMVGPSANKYGQVSPTTAQHVFADLNTEVSIILDGGPCTVGIESTILDLSGSKPIIRRHGAITTAQIADVLQQEIVLDLSSQVASGTHLSHYAPHTPLSLINPDQLSNIPDNSAVISFKRRVVGLPESVYWIQEVFEPSKFAQDLYSNLRALDRLNKEQIFVERPPATPEWIAIMDRLERASFKS